MAGIGPAGRAVGAPGPSGVRRLRICPGTTDVILTICAGQPRQRLVHLPTPLEEAPTLSAELGIDLLIKREDLAGLCVGGNKSRLMEFALGALRDAGLAPSDIDAVIPYGSGVPFLDGLEVNALTRVFGADLARKPIITIAPSIGATCAGFGAIAVAVAPRAGPVAPVPSRASTIHRASERASSHAAAEAGSMETIGMPAATATR